MIDPTKDNFTQPLSNQEILDELEICKDNYYKALSVSKDHYLDLHLNLQLNAWQTSMTFNLILTSIKR